MKEHEKVLKIAFAFSFMAVALILFAKFLGNNSFSYNKQAYDNSSQERPATIVNSNINNISTNWIVFSAEEGFSVSYPDSWYLYKGEVDYTGYHSYAISNREIPKARYFSTEMNITFNINSNTFDEYSKDLVDYLDRNPQSPNSSTFLFHGTEPSQYIRENYTVSGHRASKFTIDKQSRRQELTVEILLIELNKDKVLRVSRLLTNNEIPSQYSTTYEKAYNEIVDSIKIN